MVAHLTPLSPFHRHDGCAGLRITWLASTLLALVLLFLWGCAPISPAPVQSLTDGRSGRIRFATRTMRYDTFLQGGASSPEAMISGGLRLPKGNGRGPAVVLVHGSSGVSTSQRRWASGLSKAGYVTFLLDSFTGRSIRETATNQRRLSSASMIYDAYRALDLLVTHPRVDPKRVALMGFSKGGIVALYAALDRFHALNGTPGLRYAAHLPFYPGCSIEFRDLGKISSVPIRIFHGELDDWTPAKPCLDLVKVWRERGVDIDMTVYPDAHHGFDVFTLPATRYRANVQNFECTIVENADHVLINRDTGEPLKFTDACVLQGATIGYHPEAARQANLDVRAALVTFLGPL
ncbi:dienelactone hydrolase family protein [Candidatus Entotheonella palauensis]|uniref:Dienelactone hydrolase domain-containing protein n=1 Tax=Candidatus Entotheonella gemina TaxID=1429439 RepID=W4M9X5_9BACT|nr:dienelactone hydrolase family protein [Candidatus Entotheonella palauensis]ETX07003.1 MAG: hypothetical protein ETSY2_13740 [Candidatus Entotheonella gemina]